MSQADKIRFLKIDKFALQFKRPRQQVLKGQKI